MKFLKNFIKDYRRLNWIEKKQVNGEWIHSAIHWDGRTFRDMVDSEILHEKEDEAFYKELKKKELKKRS